MGMFDAVLIDEPKKTDLEVIFFEKDHKYTHPVTGEVIPSTSQISQSLGISKDISKMNIGGRDMGWYSDRGTLAHLGMEMYCNGEKDLSVIVEALRQAAGVMKNGVDFKDALPYLESGIKFVDKYSNITVTETEKQFLFDVGGNNLYAGTVDFVGQHNEKGVIVFDWKTSSDVNKEHYKLQIAAYALRVDAKIGGIVQLDSKGKDAEVLWVELEEYKAKWIELVKLYHSDLDDKEKKAKAEMIVKGAEEIDLNIATQIVEAKATEKTAKATVDKLKKDIIGDSKGKNFINTDAGVSITWVGSELPKLDDVAYYEELNKVTNGEYSKLIEDNDRAMKELTDKFEADKEKLLTEANASEIEKKHTTYEMSGTYRLTVKKPEKAQKVDEKPAEKPAKKAVKKAEPKASVEVPFEAPAETPVATKPDVVAAEAPRFKSKIEEAEYILRKKKKLSDDVIAIFKLNVEKLFSKKWNSPEMETQKGDTILDLADQAKEENIKKMHEVFNKDKVLPGGE